MRHRKSINHLGRTSTHRKAMMANLASSLILHKRVTTTVAKAKALRTYVEPLITKAKDDSTHSRRVVFSYLQDKEAVTELFREVSKKVGDRPGGYTRILKLGTRQGDNADMAYMELVDYNENLLSEKDAASKSKSRRRRGGKSAGKKAEETVAAVDTAVEVEEKAEVKAEAEVEEKVEAKTEEVIEAEAPVAEETVAPEAKVEEVVEEPAAETKVEEEKKEEAAAPAEEPKKKEPKAEAKKAEDKKEADNTDEEKK